MSLVGKELEVSFAATTETFVETDEESSGLDDAHRPLSPATGAESLFVSGLQTSAISANALASELHKNHRPLKFDFTVATDDFHSTFDTSSDLHKFYNYDNENYDDAAEFSKKEVTSKDSNMSNSTSSINVDEINVDAAAHVYEGAKNLWGWGKEQMVISTFLGMAEGIAGKIASVAGTDLEEIDGNLKPQLSSFDSGILNPAIKQVLSVILNAAGKGEEIFKPMVVSILKPIGLIKDDGSKETIAPELTNTRMTTRVS